MRTDMGDAEQTRARILRAARHLFAQRDISSVSIRDIAEAAQVSHGLVQRYFGTRDEMIEGIIRQEIDDFMASTPHVAPAGGGPGELEEVAEALRTGVTRFHDFAALIVRAELGGVEPARFLERSAGTPAMQMAEAVKGLQARAPAGDFLDARLVSAYVNAALFAFATMPHWLMTSVGLAPEDYDQRLDELVAISVRLLMMAAEPLPPLVADR